MIDLERYFKPFTDEVGRYAKGVHRLKEGVSLEKIEVCEEQLGIKLPLVYKKFLTQYNGGILFTPSGPEFSQIWDEEKGPKRLGLAYLDEVFNSNRRWPNMPANYIKIATTCYGDIICIDLNHNDGQEARIVQWGHEEQGDVAGWSSLIGWLMAEMKIGKKIVNYDGTDK